MSGKDDPFGSGGKTVIRPNPAGRPRQDPFRTTTDAGIAGPPPIAPQGYPPAAPQAPAPYQSPYGATPAPQAPVSFGSTGGTDDWMSGGTPNSFFASQNVQPQAPLPVSERIPLEVALNARDGGEYSASNPITAAAAPLLILLGRLRLLIVDMQAVPLMNHVAQSIREFEKKVLEAGVSAEDAKIAKYALCGTADDIVQNLPGTDRGVWMQYSMLAQFFNVRTSGVGFFQALKEILANPAPRYDLLELMHACLSLGFEGQYRGAAGGDAELQRVRRDVYQTLRQLRMRNDDDISPRWQGMAKMMQNVGSAIPSWVIAGVAGALLVGVFFLLRLIISGDGDAMAARLIALNPSEPITIERASFVPFTAPPEVTQSTQLERLRGRLADDIAAGGLVVEPVGKNIVIQVSNLLLFAPGKADVVPAFEPIAERIAAALEAEPGPINVIGHTDSVKLKPSNAFKSNYDLSVARAKSVAKLIEGKISDPTRFSVEGKGEDEPIGDNKTAEGRAKNRRVELSIIREEEL